MAQNKNTEKEEREKILIKLAKLQEMTYETR